MTDALLQEFDQELASTRKTLERVPEDKFDWAPHEKSGKMVWLAGHATNIPQWATLAITQDSLDLEPGGQPPSVAPAPETTQEFVANFDKNAADARSAIAGVADSDLEKSWSLLSNGKTMMTRPKAVVLRTFVMNHMIHHRAQLGVYLRLNDVLVTSIYGPSADEAPDF